MAKEKLIELFVECFENCELSSKITIHNTYIIETSGTGEYEIYNNDDYFFNTFFDGQPMEAVRATFFGKYRYNDDWVWLNRYANLESGSYEEDLPFREAEEMAEWYIEHYDEIDNITEMEEFCDACEEDDD